ncbi:MAG: PQQ-like beta-propeller repeat protein [Planctomycetota bacterium]|nr:PQQ-like beta-propeller repeat protein [Planctomycetota bacterium]
MGRLFACALAVCCGLSRAAAADREVGAADAGRYWPAWRGPLSTGVAPHADPPVEWSERKNIRWKIGLPGKGHSTPIVWGDQVFVTTAVPYGEAAKPERTDPHEHDNLSFTHHQRLMVLAINRRDGKIAWERVVHKELPHEGGHHTGSYASNSPVTDGEYLFAFFGSRGLYCLTVGGEDVWTTDLGEKHTKHAHGEGSSPTLHGDTLVVNWDHEGQSFVTALDKRTGKPLWKVARQEESSWATPIVVEHRGKLQVVVSGTNRLRGYDLRTGDVIWECGGLSRNIVASPVSANGMVYAGSSYGIQAMLAIRLDGARGDLTGTDRVVWSRRRSTPYVPSLLLYGEALYFLHHYQPILSRVDAKTGDEPHGPNRLPGIRDIYASPVAAANRVYITDLSGATLVIRHGGDFRPLAHNRLDDRFSASAALVGRELYLRGEQHLYCIAESKAAE